MVHAFSLIREEKAEAEALQSQGQPWLHSKTMFQKSSGYEAISVLGVCLPVTKP